MTWAPGMLDDLLGEDERKHRECGEADLHEGDGVVFGVAYWRAGPSGDRWYARAVSDPTVMTVGRTVDEVTKRLARKIEARRTR